MATNPVLYPEYMDIRLMISLATITPEAEA